MDFRKVKIQLLLSLIAMLMLTSMNLGCSTTYDPTYTTIRLNDNQPLGRLSLDCSVYIMSPQNGRFETVVYPQSGIMTAEAIRAAFLEHITRATISDRFRPYEEELVKAKVQGYTYLVQPEILLWEERNTAWTGMPDRIKVKISIAEAATGKTIDSVIISGKSKLASLSNTYAQDLLPTPINNYVSSLFR